MGAVREAYQKEVELANRRRQALPAVESTLRKVREVVGEKIRALPVSP
jgi:hypothetical protein